MPVPGMVITCINTLRPRQNGRHFTDTFKRIFLNENVRVSIKISLKFVPKGPINNIPALVQILACRQPGDNPLSEPMVVSLLTQICVTRPQWVKGCMPFTLLMSIDAIGRHRIWSGYSGNGLPTVRRQAISWTNADSSSIGPPERNFSELWKTVLDY